MNVEQKKKIRISIRRLKKEKKGTDPFAIKKKKSVFFDYEGFRGKEGVKLFWT